MALAAMLTAASCGKETPKPERQAADTAAVSATLKDYTAGAAQKPRSIACAGGKVYVSCGHTPAILCIDTAGHRIESMLEFNTSYDLEGIAVAGDRLYATSSWTTAEDGSALYDNRVFVVERGSMALVGTITVPTDPTRIAAIDDGHLIVVCGNGYDAPATTAIIDIASGTVSDLELPLTAFDVKDGMVYGYSGGGYTNAATYYRLDPATGTFEQVMQSCNVANPYSIRCIGDKTYLTTYELGAAGDVVCVDGWRSEAGMLPSKIEPLADGTAYVLCEGNWGGNDASLSRVDLASGSIANNVFGTANGRGLGDVAQDIAVYGSKAYITVSFSNTIEVVSTADNSSIQLHL